MISKIDQSIFKKVQALSSDREIEAIVYTNNLDKTKQVLNKELNCDYFNEYPFINALGFCANFKKLQKLAGFKEVKYITAETKVFTQMHIAKEIIGVEHFHKEGFKGKGVCVCVIDTGVSPHLDLLFPRHRVKVFKDFINKHEQFYDDNGHGTFITSVLAGNGLCSGEKYCGVAPECDLICLKVLDGKGETGAFSVLEAMQWVHENAKKYNIKVVCMSFGSSPMDYMDPLMLGAETLWESGICVVCAAGNSGPSRASIKSPGISRKILTVGALNDNRDEQNNVYYQKFKVADFSSRGPSFNYYKPDLLAPGVDIVCCARGEGLYTKMSGTSVATPMVAGLCALIYQKYPRLTPNEIKKLLISNCHTLNFDRNSEGYGVVDASKI